MAMMTGHERIQNEFERLGPWITRFAIQGREYGGSYDALADRRIGQFFQHYPNISSVLELGSLEGGHTFALAAQPNIERVVAVEGRRQNVDKSRFVQGLLGGGRIEFVLANLETADLRRLGSFDAVFCVGILYHLPKPWRLIEQIARVSENLFLWTHYAPEISAHVQPPRPRWRRSLRSWSSPVAKDAIVRVNGLRGIWYSEFGLSDPLSGLSARSFWPSFDSLLIMLDRSGFTSRDIIDNSADHPYGPYVTLAGSAPGRQPNR